MSFKEFFEEDRDKHAEKILQFLFPYDYDTKDLCDFVSKLNKTTKNGFLVQDRKQSTFSTLKSCMVGSECIDWMMKNTTIASSEENLRRRLTLKFFCQS
jgi:hypothetical protein